MELFYRTYGEGPPLIILHGLYGSSDNWISVGKALSSDFSVYLVDQRNHGQSPHHKRNDYPSMVEDLRSFMEIRQMAKAILVGHSMGGKTAMHFSVLYPEQVQALVVVDISTRSYPMQSGSSSAEISHREILEALLQLDTGKITDREDADNQLAASIPFPRIRSFLLKNLQRNQDNSYGWKMNLDALYRNLSDIMKGLDQGEYDHGNAITGFPVLFIRGEKSGYIRDEDIPAIIKFFPAADVTTIPGAGHWLHVEQPELLVKTLRYFLLGS